MLKSRTYQARQYGPHIFAPKGPDAPKWYLVDANGQIVGRLATLLANIITGKLKAQYTRHADVGDFVVVTNVEKVALTRNKWRGKIYAWHTGFIGGVKRKSAEDMRKSKPEEILRHAVWGMMGKTTLAKKQMKKLKLIVGSAHPHAAQDPQPLPKAFTRRTVLAATK